MYWSMLNLKWFLPGVSRWRSTVFYIMTCNFQNQKGYSGKGIRMKVLYFPNPIQWLNNKIDIAKLRSQWDPLFNENEFKYGATQAICIISQLVSHREWGDLRGLMTQRAIKDVQKMKWSNDQIDNMAISINDVQSSIIRSLNFQSIVDKKYCDIDVAVIAARIPHNPHKHSAILVEYSSRFNRMYTEGSLPEWTVSKFEMTQFQAIQNNVRA